MRDHGVRGELELVVFATALVTLAVEVFYTRLFAAVFWRNTALAIVSLAMLGIGASGVLVYLRPRWFPPNRMTEQLAWLVGVFGVSIVASFVAVRLLSAQNYSALQTLGAYVPVVACGLVPFFFGGLVLSIVFTHCADRISTLYWFDLAGAALGAVIALPLLTVLNGPSIVPVLALVAVLTGATFARRRARKLAFRAQSVAALGLVALIVIQAKSGVLDVQHSHGEREHGLEFERWDPVARITVQSFAPDTKWLNIDSQVQTAVLRYGDGTDAGFLKHNVLQLAYRLRRYPKVLIIGPGGGSDVLAAFVAGNQNITGVEVNRTSIRLMRHELSDFNGGLYDRPEVKIRIADGRAYVAAMSGKVDLIQATFVDTFTASAAGGHTLSENYLYTVDGFGDFLDHLNEDGILSMSRWGGEAFGFAEMHRAFALAQRALLMRGASRPAAHLVAAQGAPPAQLVRGGGYQAPNQQAESMSTLLVKRTPFTDAELDTLGHACEESNFRVLWLGGRSGGDATLAALLASTDPPKFYKRYLDRTGLDVSPVSDDRPFFFDMIDPIRSLFRSDRQTWDNIYFFQRFVEIRMLHELLGATLVLVLVFLAAPLVFRLRDVRGVRRPVSTIGYFICLGLGFIGIEISLMQRFALFLEHPVYSLVVFLASILLWSGVGSARSKKLAPNWRAHAPRRALLLVVVLGIYGLAAAPLTRSLIGLPLGLKMVIAALLAFPPAYLMGMMFPLGIAAIRERAEQLVPWVWGLNSAFSVVGGVLSLCFAMSFGYTATWFVFVGAYGLAFFAMRRLATT